MGGNDRERWQAIPGYEGMYEASSYGRFRGINRVGSDGRRIRGKILRLATNHSGYKVVTLCKFSKGKTFLAHRIVWETFNGPIPEGAQVNHLDNDPKNNHLSNIEIVTSLGNIDYQRKFGNHISDRARQGRHHQQRKTHCPRGHELVGPNLMPSALAKGRRGCLACNRAQNFIRHNRNLKGMLKEISDKYHEEIVKEMGQ